MSRLDDSPNQYRQATEAVQNRIIEYADRVDPMIRSHLRELGDHISVYPALGPFRLAKGFQLPLGGIGQAKATDGEVRERLLGRAGIPPVDGAVDILPVRDERAAPEVVA